MPHFITHGMYFFFLIVFLFWITCFFLRDIKKHQKDGDIRTRMDLLVSWIQAYSVLAESFHCWFISKSNASVIYSDCSYSHTAATHPGIILLFHFTSFATEKKKHWMITWLFCTAVVVLYLITPDFILNTAQNRHFLALHEWVAYCTSATIHHLKGMSSDISLMTGNRPSESWSRQCCLNKCAHVDISVCI